MKWFIYTLLISGLGLLTYGFIYPTEYFLHIYIHNTNYMISYVYFALIVLIIGSTFYIGKIKNKQN
ncbi:hypothetical protein ACHRV5_16615 [Flavobacterium sp. FlaQc-52]|jgi:hypothetical protein|uniref:hypothetical protein n=1 Tax=Flavobacterium sp. FlaQc-52 TaxID=3374185 RepID=UPI003757D8C5